ncbi:MAG: DMT family transporter [Paracoccaceae bacterium]
MVITGGLVLGFQDTLVKASSTSTSYWQFLAIRSTLNLILVVLFSFIFFSAKALIPQSLILVIVRSLLVGICMICFFSGAVTLDFSLMIAGLYTYPLFITIMANPLLGEKLNFSRVSGLTLGVLGSFFILEPWSTEISYVQLLPICAGFFYACNIIFIKRFCSKESPMALEAVRAIIFILIGIFGIIYAENILSASIKSELHFISEGWPEITSLIILICIVASISNLLGNVLIIKGYQKADGSLLAPFDFLYLVFAVLWGRIFLGAWPSFLDFIGIILIILAGIISSSEVFKFPTIEPK